MTYRITIRQIMDLTVDVQAADEDEALNLLAQGNGTEVDCYLVDEFITDMTRIDENSD